MLESPLASGRAMSITSISSSSLLLIVIKITITCNDEDEIEVIDIARPDANGLSNNIYTDFKILNSGIVLNNSDSAGTSQLAGDISANTNYNSGDAASMIVSPELTGNDISLLEGALEVFGAEAVVH